MDNDLEITPQEVQSRIEREQSLVIIDVRELEEYTVARLEGVQLIPMRSVPGEISHLRKLAERADLAILCHHGVRSYNVTAWLRQHGIQNCYSVAGGIDRWSLEIDSSIPRY